MKTYITLSKAGHYTVTIYDNQRREVFKQRLISNLATARLIAKTFIQTQEAA